MAPNEKQLRMQRVRVGLTGLAAVLLVVAVAAAVFESASDEAPNTGNPQHNEMAAKAAVSNMLDSVPVVPNEPLAEIGVAPGSGPTDAEKAAAKEAEGVNSPIKGPPS